MGMIDNINISVIIPHFNRRTSVKSSILSALSQSFPPLEVIVVDDGSNVRLFKHDIGIEDERLRIIHLDRNLGAAAARQAGISAARGNVIAFLDDDDAWLAHKLATQVRHWETFSAESGLFGVACGWRAIREGSETSEVIIPKASSGPMDFASGCWFSPGSTLIVPRGVFDVVGPFNQDMRRLEDYEWFLRFALAGGRLFVEPNVGAIISVGRRSNLEPVRHAKLLIEQRLSAMQNPLNTRKFRRTAKAYLSLELAKASHNQGRPLLMAGYLLRSFVLKPRRRVSLRRWWVMRQKFLAPTHSDGTRRTDVP